VNITNNGSEPIDITTSDFVLYPIHSERFSEYMLESNKRSEQYTSECRQKIVGNSYISNKKRQQQKQTMSDNNQTFPNTMVGESISDRIKNIAHEKKESSSLRLHPDIQLVSLDIGETIDLYGFSCSGTARTHVKWQGYSVFFRMCKEYPPMELRWQTHIDRLVSSITSIKTEQQYEQRGGIVDKVLYKVDSYSDFCEESFTPTRVQELNDEIESIIRSSCLSVYNGDVTSHSSHTRCIQCLERISHLLEVQSSDLYQPIKTDVYHVTIRSNVGVDSIYPLWEQAKTIFASRCNYFINNMESVLSSLTKHSKIENGYTLLLQSCTYTIGEVVSYEMSLEPRLKMSSYNHKHPSDSFIELVMVLTDTPDDTDDIPGIMESILSGVFQRAVTTIQSISSIPKPL
jgi:DNA-directed RNA polymerase subunit L